VSSADTLRVGTQRALARLIYALTAQGHVPGLGVTAIVRVVASWLATVAMVIYEVIGHWHHPRCSWPHAWIGCTG
jgi:hypothetical protein